MTPIPFTEPQDDLARRLTQALESPHLVTPPAGFAARVAASAARLPLPVRQVQVRRTSFASYATRFAFAALLFVMLALAPWAAAHGSSIFPVLAECLLAIEFVLLTLWFSLSPLIERA